MKKNILIAAIIAYSSNINAQNIGIVTGISNYYSTNSINNNLKDSVINKSNYNTIKLEYGIYYKSVKGVFLRTMLFANKYNENITYNEEKILIRTETVTEYTQSSKGFNLAFGQEKEYNNIILSFGISGKYEMYKNLGTKNTNSKYIKNTLTQNFDFNNGSYLESSNPNKSNIGIGFLFGAYYSFFKTIQLGLEIQPTLDFYHQKGDADSKLVIYGSNRKLVDQRTTSVSIDYKERNLNLLQPKLLLRIRLYGKKNTEIPKEYVK